PQAPAVADPPTEPGFERIHPHARPPALFPPAPAKDAPKPPPRAAPPPPPPETRAAEKLHPPPPPPPRNAPAIPGMSEEELHALHRRFIATRAMNGETAKVSYDTLINSLA